jgi:hypothetical protein
MNQQEREEFLTDKNEWVAIFRALGIPETVDHLYNPPGAQRYLVLCRGGNTRSVSISFLLKYKYMRDALAASVEKNSLATLQLLASWADVVLAVEPDHAAYYREKIMLPGIGCKNLRLIGLDGIARLRSHPFEIPFLLEADKLLQEAMNGRP